MACFCSSNSMHFLENDSIERLLALTNSYYREELLMLTTTGCTIKTPLKFTTGLAVPETPETQYFRLKKARRSVDESERNS